MSALYAALRAVEDAGCAAVSVQSAGLWLGTVAARTIGGQ